MLDGFSLARKLRAGERVYSAWSQIDHPTLCEAMARQGFDAVVIDQQHGFHGTASSAAAIAQVTLGGAAPIVRVPLQGIHAAPRAFDMGAEGVIAPMINTVADARAFAGAVKYPPMGERSWGPLRTNTLAGFTDAAAYFKAANDVHVAFAMIETQSALDELDGIVGTPGLDAFFVGPFDLSIVLSKGAAPDPQSPAVFAALDHILKVTRAHKKIAGIYCANADHARAAAAKGFTFIALGTDMMFLREGASASLKAAKA